VASFPKSASTSSFLGDIQASASTIAPPSIPPTPRGSTLARRSLGEGRKLACYLMRSPVNLSRLRYHPDSQLVLYETKAGHDVDEEARLDPLELLARVLIHVSEPHGHLVHFYGAYANRVRSMYRIEDTAASDETETTPSRRAVNERWAELIYRIYEIDPLTCPRCDSSMKLLAFITEPVTYCP